MAELADATQTISLPDLLKKITAGPDKITLKNCFKLAAF